VSPFPSGKQPMIASLFAISNSSRQKAAAGKLLQCLLTPESQQRLAVGYEGGAPATDVYSNPGPALQNLLASAPWLGDVEKNSAANAISVIPKGAEHLIAKYETIFFNELSRIQLGEESIADGLSRAQKLAMEVARKDKIVGKR
jgi:ABC-type glycerol-3-phosphate transport system substrate-binding protein